jgi:hypothetical protein
MAQPLLPQCGVSIRTTSRLPALCKLRSANLITVGITCAGVDVTRFFHFGSHQTIPPPSRHISHPRQRKLHDAASRPWRVKQRRLRCDCGRLAITVLRVRVGSNPQYVIRLLLCPACLKLEQELHGNI